jgi:hypothetical protein
VVSTQSTTRYSMTIFFFFFFFRHELGTLQGVAERMLTEGAPTNALDDVGSRALTIALPFR